MFSENLRLYGLKDMLIILLYTEVISKSWQTITTTPACMKNVLSTIFTLGYWGIHIIQKN